MRIAERRNCVAAVQVQHLPAAADVEVHARAVDHVKGPLRIHRCQVVGGRSPVHGCVHQVHPGAGAIRPAVSSCPNMRFIHCTAPPAAPLVRLSSTHMTATVRPPEEVASFLGGARPVTIAAPPYVKQMELRIVEVLESTWREPDEGIWEVRGGRRHFTHSKVMAWVAFDRAIKSASTAADNTAIAPTRSDVFLMLAAGAMITA